MSTSSSPGIFDEIVSSPCKLGISNDRDKSTDAKTISYGEYFFQQIWQTQPALFETSQHHVSNDASILSQTLKMTWDDVSDLLYDSRQATDSQPLFFQQGKPVTDPHGIYSSNPFAAFLDSCSIIINHADFCHPRIAHLCNDLQKTFPHVYANTYLTPPNGHAVEAHADDRDVLVVQILGRKTWKVYKKVPVEFPFENEQVGKNGLEIPPSILKGLLCFDGEIVLNPGSVLYLPRGFVHEATTEARQSGPIMPSFHATVAIATHDWCLSTVLSDTIRQMLCGVRDFRKALPVGPSNEYNRPTGSTSMQQQLNDAMTMIQNNITTNVLEQNLQTKYKIHNFHAREQRDKIILSSAHSKKRKRCDECVGYNAASQLGQESVIRASTPDERNSVVIEEGRLRGLTVRQETSQALMEIIGILKKDTSLQVKVKELLSIVKEKDTSDFAMLCDFTLVSFVRCCVELGALAVVDF